MANDVTIYWEPKVEVVSTTLDDLMYHTGRNSYFVRLTQGLRALYSWQGKSHDGSRYMSFQTFFVREESVLEDGDHWTRKV